MKTGISKLLVIALIPAMITSCKKEDASPDGGRPDLDIVETAPPVQKAVHKKISDNIPGFYQSLPARYDSTSKKYPLLIFMHGMGEKGTGGDKLSLVLKNSVPKLINEKKFPASFKTNGQDFSFIVLSPQTISNSSQEDVNVMIDYAVENLRVDESRVYVIGLSMGGGTTWNAAVKYGNRIAAVVPICGATNATDAKGKSIAGNKVAVWAFHNADDKTVDVSVTQDFISFINGQSPVVAAKSTVWATGGHDSWTKASAPSLKENGMNVYEWMLQFKK
ncbi:MAG: dienelactone hydrolase family protein [Chitinophagaceae bacterium]|nr:dienelactone hydrolase family protein [Chitinophagaceae bacterium]MCW5926475.1 dienelactone hydrolase family protein [Chitinophagaceae bacterium]